MTNKIKEFNKHRQKMNEKLLAGDNKILKRVFNLDANAFKEGVLPAKTKELLGLVSSLVLRCDDCIKYHLGKCYEDNVTKEELFEVFSIGTLVGGSIVIPHLRKALEYWEELEKN